MQLARHFAKQRLGIGVCVLVTLMAVCRSVADEAKVPAPGVVVTHQGQRFEGEVTERGGDVVVKIHGVQTIIDRDDVASITYTGGFSRQFADRLAALAPEDVVGRVDLARWAIGERQYGAARDALESALSIDPNDADANELSNVVRSHIRLELKGAGVEGAPRPDGSDATGLTGAARGGRPLLSGDDIQVIRRFEWRPGDSVRVRVDAAAARVFAERHNRPWRQFGSLPQGEQAEAILTDGAPDERRAVQIVSDPPVLTEFRRAVQPLLLTGCATSGCHGPVNPVGPLSLVSPADNEAASYTNFYLLMRGSRRLESTPPAGGIFGGGSEVFLVERNGGRASRSLIIQYALPSDVSEFDHPRVPDYQPLFRSLEDPRAMAVMRWIDSLRPIAPDYGIQYDWKPPTTQPRNP